MPKFYPDNYGTFTMFFNQANDAEMMVTAFDYHDVAGAIPASGDLATIRAAIVGTGKLVDTATMSNQYQLTKCTVIKRIGVDMYGAENTTPVVGALSITPMVNNVAVLVQKRGSALGRHNRGRFFLPPYHFSQTDVGPSGTLLAAKVTALNTVFTNLLAGLTSSGTPMVLLHSSSEIPVTTITSCPVQAKAATQRRRLRP